MPLELIPVVDLMGGTVVRAVRGERAAYRPLESALCRGSAPLDVVGALLDLHPFADLYAADLDAIMRRGDALRSIEAIRRRFPGLRLWVDAGIAERAALAAWEARGLGRAVIGSETLGEGDLAASLGPEAPLVLSLDFRGERFAGPPELLADAARWPRQLIAMTLARVGSGSGPDLDRLAELVARAPGRRVFAAGGVRDAGDLRDIARCGAAGVLLASALHDRRLGRDELAGHVAAA